MPTPIPTPGPPARIPDPGVRPPGVAPSPGPAPGTGTYPKAGDPAPNDPGLLDQLGDALTPDAFGEVADGYRAVRAWISDRHNWVRVSWFAGGVAMFVVGLVMVGERPLAAGVNQVTKPVGSVVKSVYK